MISIHCSHRSSFTGFVLITTTSCILEWSTATNTACITIVIENNPTLVKATWSTHSISAGGYRYCSHHSSQCHHQPWSARCSRILSITFWCYWYRMPSFIYIQKRHGELVINKEIFIRSTFIPIHWLAGESIILYAMWIYGKHPSTKVIGQRIDSLWIHRRLYGIFLSTTFSSCYRMQ